MVISKLMGGLGNQMFQYAAGYALSLKKNTNFYIDISWFDESKNDKSVVPRNFELDFFNIYPKKFTILDSLYARRNPPVTVIEKPDLSFTDISKREGNVLLDGYWQNEKYFKNHASELRFRFRFKDPLSVKKQSVADILNVSDNTVSLSVRRGDYVTHKASATLLGALPLDYYYKAVDKITEKIKNPHFYVLSDDTDWCKKNIKLKYPVSYIDHIPGTGHEDMRLISLCRHHIIANSSFSWWGAWLNPRIDKVVVGPKRWFADDKYTANPVSRDWLKV